MQRQSERGIALVLALFLMAALSVLGASLMFLSQTETYSSMNYRMMSQARYAGEAGIQKAADFLLDPAQYTAPSDVGADLLANYNYTVSPVTWNGLPVVLSAKDGACSGSNYPVAAKQAAFCNAAKGTLTAFNANISYHATAKLLTMQWFTSYQSGPVTIQTWEITGDGTLTGARSATVEVVATVETPKRPAYGYAAFASATGCGALQFQGSSGTDSYDPSGISGATAPTLTGDGGDLGTNGNLSIGGHVDVLGDLATPRTGVGACNAGNVVALTQNGSAFVKDSEIKLPAAIIYPTPTIPAFSPLAAVDQAALNNAASQANPVTATCALFGFAAAQTGTTAQVEAGAKQCAYDDLGGSKTQITINGLGATLSLPSITPNGHVNFVLVAAGPDPAQYNINSINLGGGASLGISATSSTQGVIVDVVGKDNAGTTLAAPLDLSGGSYSGPGAVLANGDHGAPVTTVSNCPTCSNYDASMLQFVYGGSGHVDFGGNSIAAAAFYMPNAAVTIHGDANIYGAVVANTVNDVGNASIYYDSALSGSLYVAGQPVIGTFTWKRY